MDGMVLFGVVVWGFGLTRNIERWLVLWGVFIGLLCVVSLSFRRNIAGNGWYVGKRQSETIVPGNHRVRWVLISRRCLTFSHLYGILLVKNTDGDGNMSSKSANKIVWLVTIAFIAIGLAYSNCQ